MIKEENLLSMYLPNGKDPFWFDTEYGKKKSTVTGDFSGIIPAEKTQI